MTNYSVHILGPNLRGSDESFHVHAFGCADVSRSPLYKGSEFAHDRTHTYTVASQVEAADAVYSDMIDEGSMTSGEGVADLRFFPCIDALPYSVPYKARHA